MDEKRKSSVVRKYIIIAILVILLIMAFFFSVLGVRPEIITRANFHLSSSLQFSPDGKYIASAGKMGEIELWDLKTGACIQTLKAHDGPVNSIMFTPNGKYLISRGGDGLIKVWGADTFQCKSVFNAHSDSINSLSITYDSTYCAAGNSDGIIKVWEITTGKCIRTIKAYKNDSIFSVCFSSNMRYIASTAEADYFSKTKGITVWDWKNGVEFQSFLKASGAGGGSSTSDSALFTPDGRCLVSWTRWGDYLVIFDLQRERIAQRMGYSKESGFSAVCLTSDGALIAYSGESRGTKVFQTNTAKEICSCGEPSLVAEALCFSPGSGLLASADKTGVRIWDVPSGMTLLHLSTVGDNEWACWAPDAHYNCSNGAEKYLSIKFLSFEKPASNLRTFFYDPLIAEKRLKTGQHKVSNP